MSNLKTLNIVHQKISKELDQKIKEIQGEILKSKGKKPSFADITRKVVETPSWEQIEREIIDALKENKGLKLRFKL